MNFISQIKEVPYGHHTEILVNLKNNGGHLATKKNHFKTKILDIHEKKCFSIIYKNHSLPIDLVAEDVETANKWVRKYNKSTSAIHNFFLIHSLS